LNECGKMATRRKFVYSRQAPSLVDEGSKSGNKLDEVLAPYSINVFDVVLD